MMLSTISQLLIKSEASFSPSTPRSSRFKKASSISRNAYSIRNDSRIKGRLYQSSHLVTYARPIAARDGHDLPGLIDKRVPGVAAVVDDVVEGFEDTVREPILPHELPDIFLTVEFGCARRQRHEREVAWDLESLGAMPPGLIEEDDRVRAWGNFGCDFVEVELHGLAVAGRQY